MPGITTGITMVFVPSSQHLHHHPACWAAARNLLIGDLIEMQFLGNSYNYNLGSAMSLVLMVIVLLCMSFTTADTERNGGDGMRKLEAFLPTHIHGAGVRLFVCAHCGADRVQLQRIEKPHRVHRLYA